MCLDRADIVKLLIENGPNSMAQLTQIEELFYSYGVGIPVQGKTFAQFRRQLAKNVENFNAVDENGNSALHISLKHGDLN